MLSIYSVFSGKKIQNRFEIGTRLYLGKSTQVYNVVDLENSLVKLVVKMKVKNFKRAADEAYVIQKVKKNLRYNQGNNRFSNLHSRGYFLAHYN